MQVAVIGGTGGLGRLLVAELAARGDAVRVVGRRVPPEGEEPPSGAAHLGTAGADGAGVVEHRQADVRSGEGLASALEGVDVVVDTVNDRGGDEAVLVEGTRRLLAAAAQVGCRHHVAISVVGCDRVSQRYYRAKLAQEEVVTHGPVAWSLLRSTQFHSFVAGMLAAAARARIVPTGGALVQPIDPSVVARLLADTVHAGPSGRLADVGGPQVLTLTQAAVEWRRHSGRWLLPLRMPLAGRMGRALREGALCAPDHALGGPTFAQWLAAHAAAGARAGVA